MLAIAAAFSGCGSDSPTSPSGADVLVTVQGIQGNMSFSPATATIRAGQTVAWRNGDSVAHDVEEDTGAFGTGNIAPGATSMPIRMSVAGGFTYHCTLHPSMVGSLSVSP